MSNPLYKYPLDTSGTALTNRIVDEFHEVDVSVNPLIAPQNGVFYVESLIVKDSKTGRVLNEPLDYKVMQTFQDVAELSGKEGAGFILLDETLILEEGVKLTYQAVGGEYSQNVELLASTLTRLQKERYLVLWDNIIKPDAFKPEHHLHHSNDIYGMDGVVEAIHRMADMLYEYINKEIHITDVVGLKDALDTINNTLDALVRITQDHETRVEDLEIEIANHRQQLSAHAIQLQNHFERLNDHQSRVEVLEVKTENQEGRLVNVEQQLPPLTTRVTKLEEGQEGLNQTVANHDSRLTTNERDISEIKVLNTTQNGRLDDLEDLGTNHEARITDQESLMTDTRTRLAANETKDVEQDNRLGTHDIQIKALQDNLAQTDKDADALAARVTTTEQDVIALEEKDVVHESRMAAHEVVHGELQTADRNLQDDINVNRQNHERLAVEVQAIDDRVTETETRLDTKDTEVEQIWARFTSDDERHQVIQSQIQGLRTDIDKETVRGFHTAVNVQSMEHNAYYYVDRTGTKDDDPIILGVSATQFEGHESGDFIRIVSLPGERHIHIQTDQILGCDDGVMVIDEPFGWVHLAWDADIAKLIVAAGG